MKVLITGIAGMIGSHVAEECLRRGWQVHGVDNFASGKADYIPEAARDGTSVFDITTGRPDYTGYDYVFHLAAEPFIPKSYVEPKRFIEVNTLGTLNVLQGCKAVGRVLVVSSSEVYGTADETPMTEDHPLNPMSTYAVSKLAGERLAISAYHEHGIPAIVFRPFNCYGPRCTQPYVIQEIIEQLLEGNVVELGNAAAHRDFSYVADTARAIVECCVNGAVGETYHYGSGEARSIGSIAHDAAQFLGKLRLLELRSKQPAKMRPNDVLWLQADNSKFNSICEPWERTSWEAGLANMIQAQFPVNSDAAQVELS